MRITKDIGFKDSKGVLDLFDNFMKGTFNITDEEYDYLCVNMTDEEVKIMVNMDPTFADKRQMIEIRNKYLTRFNDKA
jgi:hypothetical protein